MIKVKYTTSAAFVHLGKVYRPGQIFEVDEAHAGIKRELAAGRLVKVTEKEVKAAEEAQKAMLEAGAATTAAGAKK